MHCIFLNVKIIQMCPLYLETLSLMWCVYHRLLLCTELHVSYSDRREGGMFPSSCFTTSISRHEVRCKVETLHVTTQHNIAFSRLAANSDFHTPLTPCSMKQFKYSFLFISTKKHKREPEPETGCESFTKI